MPGLSAKSGVGHDACIGKPLGLLGQSSAGQDVQIENGVSERQNHAGRSMSVTANSGHLGEYPACVLRSNPVMDTLIRFVINPMTTITLVQ